MEKKRNLPPESSQLGEPPLKQRKSEEEQKIRVSVAMAEPVQDLLKLLKKEEIVTLLINASVTDPGLEQTIRELAMEKKRNLPPESSQVVEPPLKEHKSEAEQESLPVQEGKEGDQAFKQSSTSTFGKHQTTQALITPSTSFGESLLFDSTVPTSVRKHMEAIWKQFGSEAMQKAQQPYSKCKTSSFGSFPIGDPAFKQSSITILDPNQDKSSAACVKKLLGLSGIRCHGTTIVAWRNRDGVILAVDSRVSTDTHRVADDYVKFYMPCANILIVASGNESLFTSSFDQMINSCNDGISISDAAQLYREALLPHLPLQDPEDGFDAFICGHKDGHVHLYRVQVVEGNVNVIEVVGQFGTPTLGSGGPFAADFALNVVDPVQIYLS